MLTALMFSCDMRSVRETGGRCSPCMTTSGLTERSIDAITGGGSAAKTVVAARQIINKSIFIGTVSLVICGVSDIEAAIERPQYCRLSQLEIGQVNLFRACPAAEERRHEDVRRSLIGQLSRSHDPSVANVITGSR